MIRETGRGGKSAKKTAKRFSRLVFFIKQKVFRTWRMVKIIQRLLPKTKRMKKKLQRPVFFSK
jgi:hypothetical protein